MSMDVLVMAMDTLTVDRHVWDIKDAPGNRLSGDTSLAQKLGTSLERNFWQTQECQVAK